MVILLASKNSWLYLYAFVTSALVSTILGYAFIPLLQRLKAGQIIQDDGPASHLVKAGTPTMGGIFFVPVAIATAIIFAPHTPNLLAVSLVTLGYTLIGGLDDWLSLRQKSNKGLTPRLKLLWQLGLAAMFVLWLGINPAANLTEISLGREIILDLGWGFWPLVIFVLTAESNATNLTDGVDGLAAGTGAIAYLAMAVILAPIHPDLAIFAVSVSGACLGFLNHNSHPAAVFMGDTGSLTLGGTLGAIGVLGGQIWPLFLISGIFFIESLSVIGQVSYYKATKGPDGQGKRLLKMAPLHHHLELSGWKETQVVAVFYLINALLAGLALTIS